MKVYTVSVKGISLVVNVVSTLIANHISFVSQKGSKSWSVTVPIEHRGELNLIIHKLAKKNRVSKSQSVFSSIEPAVEFAWMD